MREFRFRAWDEKNKKWAFKDFDLLGEVTLFLLLEQYKLENHCGLIIEQYTGLKDKNGADIFEGDIIDISYNYIGKKKVEFSEGAFSCCAFWMKGCEVIGNIHENGDLINVA